MQPRIPLAFAARQPAEGFSFAVCQDPRSLHGLQYLDRAASGAGDTNNPERQGVCLSRGWTGLFSQGRLNPSLPRDTAWGNAGHPSPHPGHHSLTQASEGSNSSPLMDPVTTTDAITCLAFCPGPARDYSSSSKQRHTHVLAATVHVNPVIVNNPSSRFCTGLRAAAAAGPPWPP